jgi:hypothetical protein
LGFALSNFFFCYVYDLNNLQATSEAEQNEALLRARMLNVKTNDYSGHDPAPAMEKPRSKLIPN